MTVYKQIQDGFPPWLYLEAVIRTCMKITSAECTAENSWWLADRVPETCRVLYQNKFGQLVRLVGFFKKQSITMHGNRNVKFIFWILYNALRKMSSLYYVSSHGEDSPYQKAQFDTESRDYQKWISA